MRGMIAQTRGLLLEVKRRCLNIDETALLILRTTDVAQLMPIWLSSASLPPSDPMLGVSVHAVLWGLLFIKPTS